MTGTVWMIEEVSVKTGQFRMYSIRFHLKKNGAALENPLPIERLEELMPGIDWREDKKEKVLRPDDADDLDVEWAEHLGRKQA